MGRLEMRSPYPSVLSHLLIINQCAMQAQPEQLQRSWLLPDEETLLDLKTSRGRFGQHLQHLQHPSLCDRCPHTSPCHAIEPASSFWHLAALEQAFPLLQTAQQAVCKGEDLQVLELSSSLSSGTFEWLKQRRPADANMFAANGALWTLEDGCPALACTPKMTATCVPRSTQGPLCSSRPTSTSEEGSSQGTALPSTLPEALSDVEKEDGLPKGADACAKSTLVRDSACAEKLQGIAAPVQLVIGDLQEGWDAAPGCASLEQEFDAAYRTRLLWEAGTALKTLAEGMPVVHSPAGADHPQHSASKTIQPGG